MRSGGPVLLVWGGMVAALSVLAVLAFRLDPLPASLLAGAGLAVIATGATALGREARTPRAAALTREELQLRTSLATTGLAVGGVIALVGFLAVGSMIGWPGLLLAVLGAGGVLRERRALRRLG